MTGLERFRDWSNRNVVIAAVIAASLASFAGTGVSAALLRQEATERNAAICDGQNEIRAQLRRSVESAIPRTRATLDNLIRAAATPEQAEVLRKLAEDSEAGFRRSLRQYRQIDC
jgi:hypothetical protein